MLQKEECSSLLCYLLFKMRVRDESIIGFKFWSHHEVDIESYKYCEFAKAKAIRLYDEGIVLLNKVNWSTFEFSSKSCG